MKQGVVNKATEQDWKMRQAYNQAPNQYDAERYLSPEGRFFNDLEIRILKEWIQPSPEVKLLDIPNGTGRISIPMAQAGAQVTGADISEGMLEEARKKAKQMNLDNIEFVWANCRELPFPDNTFDVVTSFKFFHLVENVDKPVFIREMYRVLKPGGKLIVEFESPFYGVFMAAYRYYFRRKHKGLMRKRCLFPDQVKWLFGDMKINRRIGVKLPFSGTLARVFGRRLMEAINLAVGKIPGLRYLTYVIIFEIEKV